MKRPDVYLKEYVRQLDIENLSFLNLRFQQKLPGDQAEIINFLSRDTTIDEWFRTATSGDDFFDMLDVVCQNVTRESERRQIA